MPRTFAEWIEFLYGPFFKVIGFFYRSYTANRARLEKLKANQVFSLVIKTMTIGLLLAWILIWALADEESQIDLVDEVKKSIGYDQPETEP